MSDIADRYRRLAAAFTEKVAAVPPDRWAEQSPCEDWTALDVVRHVVETQGLFLGFVGRDMPDLPPVDERPLDAWQAAGDVVQGDLDDPDRADEAFDGYFGRTTFAESIDRFVCLDLVIHAWDLARATGIDERLDPEEVRRQLEMTRTFGEVLRSSGVCGPELEPPPGADEQTRLLAFLGRRAWR